MLASAEAAVALLGHRGRWQTLAAAAAAGQKRTSGVCRSSASLHGRQLCRL